MPIETTHDLITLAASVSDYALGAIVLASLAGMALGIIGRGQEPPPRHRRQL